MKMKKTTAILLAAMLAATGLSACAGSKPEDTGAKNNDVVADSETNTTDDKVIDADISAELVHWVWGDYEIKGASQLNEYYPNIKVEYTAVDSDEYAKKVLSTLQANLDMPDVVNFESGARGQLNNMDAWERLDAEPYNVDMDNMVEFIKPMVQNEKGEVVCLQIDNCVGGYAYDRNLAKKYFGTDDPAEMEALFPDLDSFIEKGKEVAQQSGGQDFMFSGVDDAYTAVCPLYGASEPFVKDGKLNLDGSILPAFQFIEQLVANNAVGNYVAWTPAWNTSFTANNIIFYAAPTWYVSFVMKENDTDSEGKWGLMTPPGGGFSNGGTAYAIPKGAKEENKMAAFTYINWLTMSQEGAENFFAAHATPTLYQPAYETDLYEASGDPFFAGQNVTQKFLEISENPKTIVRPITEYDLTISNANTQAMRNLESGMSAAEAFENLKADVLSKVPALSE